MTENYGFTQPTYNIGSPLARQRNDILMAFRLRANGGLLLDVYYIGKHLFLCSFSVFVSLFLIVPGVVSLLCHSLDFYSIFL